MTEPTTPAPRFWELVFPGLGIGLLVGFLVGLSMSPVRQYHLMEIAVGLSGFRLD